LCCKNIYHFGEPDVDGRIILKWTFKNGMVRHGACGSGEGQVTGFCEWGSDFPVALNAGIT
jgi:hypothetical protein